LSESPRFFPTPEPPPPRPPEARDGSLLSWVDWLITRGSPTQIGRGVVVAVLGLSLLDYLAGPELGFSAFYLAPIAVSSWYLTQRAGIGTSMLATTLLLLTGQLVPPPTPPFSTALWSAGVQLLTFLIVTALVVRLKEALATQRQLALSDSLTGLANARAFFDRLENEVERSLRYGRVFTLAYLDLDHFKEVNDSMGHAEGDEVLRQTGETLRRSTRASDLPARLGGDEFGLVLPETPYAQADGALQKLRHEILVVMQGRGWPVTVSIGAVTFEAPVDSADAAIRIADRLMYEVKSGGRDGIRHILYTGGEPGAPPT